MKDGKSKGWRKRGKKEMRKGQRSGRSKQEKEGQLPFRDQGAPSAVPYYQNPIDQAYHYVLIYFLYVTITDYAPVKCATRPEGGQFLAARQV